MKRLFENDAVTRRANRAANLATHYFAYVAGISIAAAIAAATVVFSAQTALTWVDEAAFPERHAGVRTSSTISTGPETEPTEFAMLPSGAPLRIRNDVMSRNF